MKTQIVTFKEKFFLIWNLLWLCNADISGFSIAQVCIRSKLYLKKTGVKLSSIEIKAPDYIIHSVTPQNSNAKSTA